MKKLLSTLMITSAFISSMAFAESAASHASHSSEHSLAASGHTAVSVGMSAVSVVALPLVAVEVAGDSLQSVGDSMLDATHKHQPQPLQVTEITITVDPSPKDTMKTPEKQD